MYYFQARLPGFVFDLRTQNLNDADIERVLTACVRKPNTRLENRVLFSNTVLESVIENRTPQEFSGRTCTTFEHRLGSGCAKFDHLARGIQAFLGNSPKCGMAFRRRRGLSKNRVLFSNTVLQCVIKNRTHQGPLWLPHQRALFSNTSLESVIDSGSGFFKQARVYARNRVRD